MRPVRLEMHAFGPYANSQVLDFRELGLRQLFLIHGPTGSGKSSILDAICFALYGESTGEERKAHHLRSDFADPDAKTRVVFDFTLGADCYRIDRTPRYSLAHGERDRPRQVNATAELWRLPGFDAPELSAELIDSGVNSVKETVEKLIGLRADQFRQVVVLPQGRFREMLTASSNQRREIFSTLFQTAHYKLIEEKLKERSRSISDALERYQDQRKTILSSHGCESESVLRARIAEATSNIQALEKQKDERAANETRARESLEQARTTDRLIGEQKRAQTELDQLLEQSGQFNQVRKQLDLAGKAAQLTPLHELVEKRREEADTSKAARDELLGKLAEAEQNLESAETAFTAAEAHLPETEGQRREMDRLEGLRPRISTLEKAEKGLQTAESAVTQRTEALHQAKGTLDGLQQQLKEKQDNLGSARKASNTVQGLQLRVNELLRRHKLRTDLDSAAEVLEARLGDLQNAVDGVEIAERRLSRTRERYEQLDRSWRDGQATVLARSLSAGEPCPVCGSVHHPHPAAADHEIPNESEVEVARNAFENAQNNHNAANQQQSRFENGVSRVRDDVERLTNELGDDTERSAPDMRTLLDESERQLADAESASESVESLEQELESLQGVVTKAESAVTDAQEALSDAQQGHAAANASFQSAQQEVPNELRSIESLDRRIAELREYAERLQRAIDDAQTARDSAREVRSTLKTHLESAEIEANRDREVADGEQRRFVDRRLELGFSDDDTFLSARLSTDGIETLQRQLDDYDEQLVVARDRLKTTSDKARELVQPDLEALELASTEAREALDTVISELASQASVKASLTSATNQIEEIARKSQTLGEQFEVAEFLSGVASGDARYSKHRISFERFVLGAFLDDVLVVATEKLSTMTGGRFTLLRKLLEADGRRSTGLDLEVEDAYTGTSRDISTLSGGEGFLAALALALALSEVVQARAGGVRLDTLFVDEGFGSLDPDALDKSLTALISQNQGRLVGIISHVPELQERVDARLAVRSGREGSTARFVV